MLKDEITIICRHIDLYPGFLLLCQLPDSIHGIQNRLTLHMWAIAYENVIRSFISLCYLVT